MLLSLRDTSQCLLHSSKKAKIGLIPSKSQLLLLRVLKTFFVASLWGERGAWLCCFTATLTALGVKSPTEEYLIGQSQSQVSRTSKATVAPHVGLSCLSRGPYLSPEAEANHSFTIVGTQYQQAIGRPQDSHTHVGSALYGAALWARLLEFFKSDPYQVSEV